MRKRISARAFIRSDGLVLLSGYHDREGDWFMFPGGGQRSGETLHECLLREVEEETRVKVEIGPLRWVREFIATDPKNFELDPDFHQVDLIFECSVKDRQQAELGSSPDSGQIGLRWASIEELLSLRFFPQDVARILNNTMPDQTYLGAI